MLFGKNIASNVLNSFPADNYVMTAIRLCYCFVIVLSFVTVVYPVRTNIMEWMNIDRNNRTGKITFYAIGILLSTFGVIISILVPDIVTVFNVISALFGITEHWIIPIASQWKLPELKLNSRASECDAVDHWNAGKDIH